MKNNISNKRSLNRLAVFILLAIFTSCSNSPDIIVQKFNMQMPEGQTVFQENLLVGEIAETDIKHMAFTGPVSETFSLSNDSVYMLIAIKGSGFIHADTLSFELVPESIAIPITFNEIEINIPEGDTLHYISFVKKLSDQDKEDLKSFPEENKYDMFFTAFDDCEPYTEKIKSPNTISRTVLPQDILPRLSFGTVEAPGPDAVGAHEHAMLDQLFLGLAGNNIIVHADDNSAVLGEFELLHIPIGSSHGVTVESDEKMYYLWMDFFLTKEGQEWLKTHKPVSKDKKDY